MLTRRTAFDAASVHFRRTIRRIDIFVTTSFDGVDPSCDDRGKIDWLDGNRK